MSIPDLFNMKKTFFNACRIISDNKDSLQIVILQIR